MLARARSRAAAEARVIAARGPVHTKLATAAARGAFWPGFKTMKLPHEIGTHGQTLLQTARESICMAEEECMVAEDDSTLRAYAPGLSGRVRLVAELWRMGCKGR